MKREQGGNYLLHFNSVELRGRRLIDIDNDF